MNLFAGHDGHRVRGRPADPQLPDGLLLGLRATGLRRVGQPRLHVLPGPDQALQRIQLPLGPAELPNAGLLLKTQNKNMPKAIG